MKLTLWDRLVSWFSPEAGLRRLRFRTAAGLMESIKPPSRRGYDAAQPGRRTDGWARNRGDVNAVIQRAAGELRMHARDLLRNNAWARRAVRVIANNTVGWGIVPKAAGGSAEANAEAMKRWKAWAETTACDADGRLTFAGLQHLVVKSIVTDGEILVRRRYRRAADGLPIPLQLQVLEADFLDTAKDGIDAPAGGPIVQGVEYDLIGRRVAYWLFEEHPGSSSSTGKVSKRVPARDILQPFYQERPGQTRGVSWLGSVIVGLKDLDDYEDAELLKQKIAACFTAFVTDRDGGGGGTIATTAGQLGTQSATEDLVEELEPGQINHLAGDKEVTFGNPPQVTVDNFTVRNLRKIAAGFGISYEDLTGDYTLVNFSSARMGRIAFTGNVRDWQTNVMIPFCTGVWAWAMEGLALDLGAEWTVPPLPMLEPDKEGLAIQRLIRVGALTPSGMVREQGGDPDAHWEEYSADMKKLDELGIKLDSDVRAVSQAGLTQQRAGVGGEDKPPPKPVDE